MKKSYIILALILCIFTSSYTYSYSQSFGNLSKYARAKQMAENGNLLQAISIIEEIIKEDKSEALFDTLIEYQLNAGMYETSIETINNALKEYPDSIKFLFLKGQIYEFYQKDYSKAYEIYKEVLKKSDDPKHILAAATAAELTDNMNDALKYLTSLIKKDENNSLYYAYRGRLYYKMKKERNAIKDLEKAISINNDFTARLILAEIYANTNKSDKAIKILEELSKENALLSNPIDENIGKIYLKEQNYTKAIEIYKNLADKLTGKSKAQALQLLGSIYVESGSHKEAALTFEEVTRILPDESQNFFIAAKLYEYTNNLPKAEDMYKALLKLKPDYAEALKRITVVYLLQNKPDEAFIYINKIDEVERDVDYYLLKAECYTMKKNFKESIKILENGLKENPTNPQILYYLASLYAENKDIKKSLEYIKQAYDIEPENHNFQNFLAYTYAELNMELDTALKLIKKALEKEPENAAYLDTIAWVYYKQKDYKNALKFINKALKITPKEKEMLDHKKDIENAMKQK